MINSQIKEIIENNPIFFATVMEGDKPNAVGVDKVKVVSENQILITDNYMKQTIKDLAENKNVCIIVWGKELRGYKIIGEAEYHTENDWHERVKNMPENAGEPAKGAILVNVTRVIELH
ncbi:MAG: pyridoxamine 5'-phosphate oxidase family protein [Magnetococcus sp. WYHC-3]